MCVVAAARIVGDVLNRAVDQLVLPQAVTNAGQHFIPLVHRDNCHPLLVAQQSPEEPRIHTAAHLLDADADGCGHVIERAFVPEDGAVPEEVHLRSGVSRVEAPGLELGSEDKEVGVLAHVGHVVAAMMIWPGRDESGLAVRHVEPRRVEIQTLAQELDATLFEVRQRVASHLREMEVLIPARLDAPLLEVLVVAAEVLRQLLVGKRLASPVVEPHQVVVGEAVDAECRQPVVVEVLDLRRLRVLLVVHDAVYVLEVELQVRRPAILVHRVHIAELVVGAAAVVHEGGRKGRHGVDCEGLAGRPDD